MLSWNYTKVSNVTDIVSESHYEHHTNTPDIKTQQSISHVVIGGGIVLLVRHYLNIKSYSNFMIYINLFTKTMQKNNNPQIW